MTITERSLVFLDTVWSDVSFGAHAKPAATADTAIQTGQPCTTTFFHNQRAAENVCPHRCFSATEMTSRVLARSVLVPTIGSSVSLALGHVVVRARVHSNTSRDSRLDKVCRPVYQNPNKSPGSIKNPTPAISGERIKI